jgi:hypothetical protein
MAKSVKIIIFCHVVCQIFINILQEPAISIFLQMEAIGSSEVLVIIYQTTWCYSLKKKSFIYSTHKFLKNVWQYLINICNSLNSEVLI